MFSFEQNEVNGGDNVLATQDTSLDNFAEDFLTYVCRQFGISNKWQIKVIACDQRSWQTIPPKVREKLDRRYEKQKGPIALVYGVSDEAKVSGDYRRICLGAAGFTQQQVDSLSQFDVLFFVRTDQRIPNHRALPYPALLVTAHMTLHFAELILHQTIIQEPNLTHNYEAAVHLLSMFVEKSGGIANFLELYRY